MRVTLIGGPFSGEKLNVTEGAETIRILTVINHDYDILSCRNCEVTPAQLFKTATYILNGGFFYYQP